MPPSKPIALNLATIVHRLLTNPRGWEVQDLCEELEIADRTYRKYRQLLQEEFFPLIRRGKSQVEEIQEGSTRYLRIVEGRPEPSRVANVISRLTAHHLARRVLRFLGQKEGENALDEAFHAFWARSRTAKRFPSLSRIQNDLDRLFHFVPDAPKDYTSQQEVLEVVLECLVGAQQLRMTYESAAQGAKEHTIEPLTLAMYRSGLHLFARYAGKKRVYNFVVDRIQAAEVVETRFDYPAAKAYSPGRFTESSFGIFFKDSQGRSAKTQVELVFADKRWLKLYLREREWASGQAFRELSDGRLQMTFSVHSLVEVWPWIRGFGGDVAVVAPKPHQQTTSDGQSRLS
jgi:predicted DNA-binding transcriptional regulator YafY